MAAHKTTARRAGAWICFEDESGQHLRPAKVRTWAPRGQTPVVKVTGMGYGRVSLAGLVCTRPGRRTRFVFRTRVRHSGRRHEPKGFTARSYVEFLDEVHRRLGGPIVLVWDNERRHVGALVRQAVEAREWLTVFRFPTYAPELNPVEGVWSHLRRGLGNLTPRGIDQLAVVVRSRLRKMQHRPGLLEGFIAETGLDLPQR
ncbi:MULTISPECIES: transposase [unclassified Nocardiopsis]|uniref:transposase n=1 Tax=Nocardiopsis TaxID=2013 RepID=UPI00387B3912